MKPNKRYIVLAVVKAIILVEIRFCSQSHSLRIHDLTVLKFVDFNKFLKFVNICWTILGLFLH